MNARQDRIPPLQTEAAPPTARMRKPPQHTGYVRRWSLMGLTLLTSLVGLCSVAQAQDDDPILPDEDFYVGAFLGTTLNLDEWDLHENPDNGSTAGFASFSAGARAGMTLFYRLSLEAELGYVPFVSTENDELNHTIFYRAAALGNLTAPGTWVPFAQFGLGNYHNLSGDHGSDVDARIDYGLGIRGALNDGTRLRLDVRHVITDGIGEFEAAHNIEIFASVDFVLWGSSPAPPPPVVEEDNDWDDDGVLNADDECPRTAGTIKGCPDDDGDGLANKVDKCPEEAGLNEFEGCPDPDADGDGILRDVDQCPDEAEDKDKWQDEDGCPDPDNDFDNIPDDKDQCPNEAEVVNGVDDTDGCPDEGGLVEVDCKEIKIKDRVFFATGKDTIRKQSHKLLDAVADVLKAQPRIKKIRIEGHTDDVGDEDDNKKLSQARAEAVKAYLVAKGVEASRLDTKGYGESRPIVKLIDGGGNKLRGKGLRTARASNRRVEFAIVDQEPCKETKKAP